MKKGKLTAIDTEKGKWKLIAATGIFAFIFINIFEPFGLYSSKDASVVDVFVEVNIGILTVVAVLALTHFPLRKLLGIASFSYATILLWFLFESVLTSTLWTGLDVLFAQTLSDPFHLFSKNLFEYFFLIGPPYFGAIFYLSFASKSVVIYELQKQLDRNADPETMIVFSGSSGTQRISLQLKDVLFLESDDNYVILHFKENEVCRRIMLRNTLKGIEAELSDHGLIRCHRSFIVNPLNIASKTKTRKGAELRMDCTEKKIVPVSRTYVSQLGV